MESLEITNLVPLKNEEKDPITDGDIFDEQTGEQLGATIQATTIYGVIELSVLCDGWWYVFKLERKYENKEKDDDNKNL